MTTKHKNKNQPRRRTPEVLRGCSIQHVADDAVEGKDYVNVIMARGVRLGRFFHPDYHHRFETIIGPCNSISEFTAKLTYPEYQPPVESGPRPKTINHAKNCVAWNLKPQAIENYYAVLAEAIWARLNAGTSEAKKALEFIRNFDGVWTSFVHRKIKQTGLFVNMGDSDYSVVSYNTSMRNYLQIMQDINTAVRTANDEKEMHMAVYRVIRSLIVNDKVGFYHGVSQLPEELQNKPFISEEEMSAMLDARLAKANAVETKGDVEDKPEEKKEVKKTAKKATKKKVAKKKAEPKTAEVVKEEPKSEVETKTEEGEVATDELLNEALKAAGEELSEKTGS